jgi:hypothetical protein
MATSEQGDTVMSEEQQWVVAPHEARIEIAIGQEAKLSPELREALERLAAVVEQQQEVQGYGVCEEISVHVCEILVHCSGVSWD